MLKPDTSLSLKVTTNVTIERTKTTIVSSTALGFLCNIKPLVIRLTGSNYMFKIIIKGY
jgi:hypothetical protein